ncbi:Protein HLB1 [Bienertia sinuspersici]
MELWKKKMQSYQMRSLISLHSEPHFLIKTPSISFTKKKPIFILHQKWLLTHQNTISSSIRASCTTNSAASCNGWDDFRIWVEPKELGESNNLKKFLISLGINDNKYVFTCILGFICALAISRVRVSSIIVFPAAAIIFAIGFTFGFARGKPHKELNFNETKTREKADSLRVYVEKLKGLVEIFDGFDVKVGDLKNDIKNAIEYERVDLGDLESYENAIEGINGLILNARNLVEDCIDGASVEVHELEKNSNQKNIRKKKENSDKRFDLFGFMGSFLRYDHGGSKSNKTNFVKRDVLAKDIGDQGQENVQATNGNRKNEFGGKEQETKRNLRRGKMNKTEAYMNTKEFINANEYNYQNIQFRSGRRFNLNMSSHDEFKEWTSNGSMSSNTNFDIAKENLENEPQEVFRRAYESTERREDVDFGSFGESFRQERVNVEDELHYSKYQSRLENDLGSFSSSAVSDDMMFDKCLRKAKDLLKQAKECLKDGIDEHLAEEMLQESSKLLSQAIALKPMSLLAIGQLGNTYLLHGELKLKKSRELRNVLSKSDDFGLERSNILILEDAFPNKDGVENLLISACEDCEALLVEAGRKYRTALSIDGNDVRALYNWGLALSFRAQLIADVGPEAALDADKLFLAAIDKFNAMMSKSNDYAPEALFRWGMALQQRSRLRPNNTKDKVKLLQQAKRLYEDAANMGSNNRQVRKALTSCISELNFNDI